MSSPTMMPMSLTEIAQAVDGRLMPTTVPTDEPVAISAFTDSRQIVPGSVFVAIAGERVDGHDFVPKVGAQGAVAALVDHEIAGAQVPQIVVENTVKALGALAKHNIERRRALESPFTVIGITGSVGKTTTKDLLKSLLSKMGDTVAPVGSFNNEIGLPLTSLKVNAGTRFLVAEMGANHVAKSPTSPPWFRRTSPWCSRWAWRIWENSALRNASPKPNRKSYADWCRAA